MDIEIDFMNIMYLTVYDLAELKNTVGHYFDKQLNHNFVTRINDSKWSSIPDLNKAVYSFLQCDRYNFKDDLELDTIYINGKKQVPPKKSFLYYGMHYLICEHFGENVADQALYLALDINGLCLNWNY